MSFVAAESFDYWNETILPGPFDSYYTDGAGETTHSEFVVSTAYGRDSSAGLRLLTADYHVGSRGQLVKYVNFLTGCVVGFAFYMPTTSTNQSAYQHRIPPVPIVAFNDGTQPQVTIAIDSAMQIGIYRGAYGGSGGFGAGPLLVAGTGPLHENVWHYLEVDITISNTVGSVTVYLDGKQIISQGSLDTQYTINQYITSFVFGGWDTAGFYSGYYYRFDDFYLLDHSGVSNNAPLGDVQVIAILPTIDGNKREWTPSSGTLHYAMIDETVPPFSTDYIQSDTVGQIDTFRYGTIGVPKGTIHALMITPWASKSDTTIIATEGILTDGATYQEGPVTYLSISEQYTKSIIETNTITPGRFTLSQLAAYYFGVKRVA